MLATSMINRQILTKETTIQRSGNSQLELRVIVLHKNNVNVQTLDTKKFIAEKRLLLW